MSAHRMRQVLSATLLPALLIGLCAVGCSGEVEQTAVPADAVDAADAADLQAAEAAEAEQVVEAACGQCQFELPGEGCDLAVRINGVAAFVAGTKIDEHGDAHADDGFCNSIRQARVRGQLEGDRFVTASFELLPDTAGDGG